jgi:hypothetical protein
MSSIITDSEWAVLSNITDDTLIHMAADLTLPVPTEIDRRSLCDECVKAIVERAMSEGLPLSKYDREDLEMLSAPQREAIGRLQGLKPGANVVEIIRSGRKIYRFYLRYRPDNPVAMMVPALLPAIARRAGELQAESGRV